MGERQGKQSRDDRGGSTGTPVLCPLRTLKSRDNTRQDKTRQDKTRQDKTDQGKQEDRRPDKTKCIRVGYVKNKKGNKTEEAMITFSFLALTLPTLLVSIYFVHFQTYVLVAETVTGYASIAC